MAVTRRPVSDFLEALTDLLALLEEAGAEVLQILDLYRSVYEDILAVPVVKGKKTEKEKFPGGLYTTTVEGFVPSTGRGIQAATSHCLGQNFAKMFNIEFEDDKGSKSLAWQNSWGLTTRSIGIMIMVHGDDKGLVLPPRAAPLQIVLVPLFFKDKDNTAVANRGKAIISDLNNAGLRAHIDDRDLYNPGWKYNHWEVKGVPIRLELGPRDLEGNTVVIVRRDNNAKEAVTQENLVQKIKQVLDDIHNSLLTKAREARDAKIARVLEWDQFVPALDARNIVLSPWCEETECEENVKIKTTPQKKEEKPQQQQQPQTEAEKFEPLSGAAKSLCMPFDQPALAADQKCFCCGKPAKTWCLWGRSY